jgi:hypothetical protein
MPLQEKALEVGLLKVGDGLRKLCHGVEHWLQDIMLLLKQKIISYVSVEGDGISGCIVSIRVRLVLFSGGAHNRHHMPPHHAPQPINNPPKQPIII